MKLPRTVALTSVALAGALALTACGSDDNDSGSGSSDSSSSSSSEVSGTLNGEGSTAQKNAIEQVISGFSDANPDATVNYNPTGSGDGVANFIAGQVDWAGSDSALSSEASDGVVQTDAAKKRCGGNDAWNLPMAAGPIAVTYNLPDVKDPITLSASTIGMIFMGKITKWNDPAIAKENPGVTLPSTAITVFYRSDESGTTQNFEKYLAAADPTDFTAEPSKVWPGKVGQGRAKSDGVASGVKGTVGGIAYIEWSYATSNNLGVAKVDNGGGAVELTGETAGNALNAAKIVGTGNDLKLEMDYATKEADAYPIVLVTYEIVCSKGLDADKTKLEKAFLKYFSSTDTQAGLEKTGYAPLPAEVQTKVAAAVDAIS